MSLSNKQSFLRQRESSKLLEGLESSVLNIDALYGISKWSQAG